LYTASSKEWKEYPQSSGKVVEGYVMEDDMYVNEMQHFVGAIQGKHKYMYSLEDDKRTLELLNAAEKSWKDRRTLEMKN
jgi:predicted dehydrogenase